MTDVGLDDLPLATLVVDAERTIEAANAAALDLTGRPDLVGCRLDDLLARPAAEPPAWLDRWHPSARLRSAKGIREHAVTLRRPDGSTVAATVTGRYRRGADGGLAGAVLSLRPAQPRGPAVPSGIEVVSTVSHELRSPLTSVKGYTSLLLSRWDRIGDAQKRTMLEQVHHDADRVTRLVNELLDISRLETGRLHLRRQMVDVAALAASVVEKLTLEHPELDCTLDFPEQLPSVYADPDKVEQVLTNLVENAVKYASPDGLVVQGSLDDGHLAVSVHDKGPGIPSSDLPRVFTKFFRRDHGRPTGSGLGLWISRGLVEAHGGRLTASSIEGQGSTFRFTLPTDAFERLLERETQ